MTAGQASFSRFDECTKEDMELIADNFQTFAKGLPDRVLAHLKLLNGDFGGFNVDRLEHCLQTATRAHQDGRDEEYVVCCLLHDIGDTLGSYDHGAIAAAILKPFVSNANHWLLQHHPVFQAYYYNEHLGGNKNARDKYQDSPYFEHTREFIEKYDMPSFDKDFESMSLDAFEPMLRNVLRK